MLEYQPHAATIFSLTPDLLAHLNSALRKGPFVIRSGRFVIAARSTGTEDSLCALDDM